nr:basic leucine zipper 4 [Ipomoea batatas]
MMCEEFIQYELPVFTPCEMRQLFSSFEPNLHVHSTSTSETTPSGYSLEEKRQRRKISNRESARRSRWRKKMHSEKLQAEASHLKVENRKLKNRLYLVSHRYQALQRETNRLLTMSSLLQQRLTDLSQIWTPMQLHNNSSNSTYYSSSYHLQHNNSLNGA